MKSIPRCAPNWPAWKNAAVPRSRNQSRLESQLREFTKRRDNVSAELERLGIERARLLSDNIELDARAATLAEEISIRKALCVSLRRRKSSSARR